MLVNSALKRRFHGCAGRKGAPSRRLPQRRMAITVVARAKMVRIAAMVALYLCYTNQGSLKEKGPERQKCPQNQNMGGYLLGIFLVFGFCQLGYFWFFDSFNLKRLLKSCFSEQSRLPPFFLLLLLRPSSTSFLLLLLLCSDHPALHYTAIAILLCSAIRD